MSVDIHEDEVTELQACLRPDQVGRDFDHVASLLMQRGVCIRELITERAMGLKATDTLTLLDAGCGTGRAISHAVRQMPLWVSDFGKIPPSFRGVGVDLNPLPHRIPEPDLRAQTAGPEQAFDPSFHRVQLVRDDVTTLRAIASESVDTGFSVGCLPYVEDALSFLSSVYRVLKEGASMTWTVDFRAFCEPDWDEISKKTPGAREVFHIWRVNGGESGIVRCKKKNGAGFSGFPFKFVRAVTPMPDHPEVAHRFFKKGIYREI